MSWIYRILVNILFIVICIKDAVCNICKININLQSWDYNLTWTVKTFALVHYHFNLKFQKFEMSSSILHLIETGDTVTPFQWQWIPFDGTETSVLVSVMTSVLKKACSSREIENTSS